MSSIDYKQKYLKYKNKYLELKTQQELKPQTGGFVYAPGKYLFFIPENKSNFDTDKPSELGQDYKTILVNTNGTIVGSLDNLTNYLGNCTKFLRVGKTSTGYDLANTYNTLYSNQSSSDIVKREAKDVYVAAKPYIDTVVDTTKKMMEKNIDTNNKNHVKQSVKPNKITKQDGGEGEGEGESEDADKCVRKPKKIDKNLLIGDINSVREDKLIPIVNTVNELQGNKSENKISRIILVEKPIVPGKSSTIDMSRNFIVNYDNGNVQEITLKII